MPDIFVATGKEKEAAADNDKDNLVDKSLVHNKDKSKDDFSFALPPDRKIHLFSSFCENPVDISFENQEEDEKILLFLRNSRFLNIKWVLISAALFLAPFFALPLINLHSIFQILPFKYLTVFTLFYYLIVLAYVYVNFITWYFNVVLITSLRIIDVDFSGLIYKNIATTKLSLVQDVSFQQVGVIRNLFDYGELLIQTAGTLDNFRFEASPEPQKAVHIIEELIGKK